MEGKEHMQQTVLLLCRHRVVLQDRVEVAAAASCSRYYHWQMDPRMKNSTTVRLRPKRTESEFVMAVFLDWGLE